MAPPKDPERGHSCPQQLPNGHAAPICPPLRAQYLAADRNVRAPLNVFMCRWSEKWSMFGQNSRMSRLVLKLGWRGRNELFSSMDGNADYFARRAALRQAKV